MKSLGISDHNRYARFISNQPQYSLVSRQMDREVLPLCIEENVGVIPWGPIGGGFLSGKYPRGEAPTEGRLSSKAGESSWMLRNSEKNFRILEEVLAVSSEIDQTPVQVALNWLIHKRGLPPLYLVQGHWSSTMRIWEQLAGSSPQIIGTAWIL